jgi:hypothetical protein
MVTAITCGFCRAAFEEDQAQPTCAGCPLKGGCQLVRCPHCGYENPVVPIWLTRLRDRLHADRRRDAARAED